MKREQLIEWAQNHGWKLDQWGHLRKDTKDGAKRRLKLSRIAVRYEVKSKGWVRIQSGYFSKLSISEDGKLTGMTR